MVYYVRFVLDQVTLSVTYASMHLVINGVCVESCEPLGECSSSTLYPALDSSIETINNVTMRCEAPPVWMPIGAVVGGAIAGVIIMVMVVGCGLLLCMCCSIDL